MNKKLTFVLGGARSGKTAFAEGLCNVRSGIRVYVATAQALDAEMFARIRQHRQTRGEHWETVEAPIELSEAISHLKGKGRDIALVDCITIWVSNLLSDETATDEHIFEEAGELLTVLQSMDLPMVVVSNETGLSIVPDNALARRFRDVSGKVNQMIAAAADEVFLVVAGIPVKLKG